MNVNVNVSVSHGTLRQLDLLNAFGAELYRLDEWRRTPHHIWMDNFRIYNQLYDLEENHEENPDASLGNEAWNLIFQLIDMLNSYAPTGFYFGQHPGNSSDFGFWQDEY